MNEIEKICDEVAIISNGKLVEQSSIENLQTNLEEHFLDVTEVGNV